MPQHITETTILICDKGATPTPLSVTSQTFMHIEGKLQATEEDKKPNVNIKPFGVCSITKMSCNPAPIKWQNTSVFEIDGKFVATGGGAQTAPIQIKRPKWDDVYANYPKNATGSDDLFGPDFYEKLFGKRYNKTTYLLDNKTKLYNGCAGKVSTALALSGCYIQKTGGIGIDFIASENRTFGGVYTNDYRNKKSLENTPDWGTKN